MRKLLLLPLCLLPAACPSERIGMLVDDASVQDEAGVPIPVNSPDAENLTSTSTWSVYFSPNGGCTAAIVALIASAKTEVLVQAYSFTSPEIEAALIAQGPKVKVILDRSDVGTLGLQALMSAGISVVIDKKHVIAHNKVIIVDSHTIETGSFNYTQQAERQNAENCLLIRNTAMAIAYRNNWLAHQAHSVSPTGADQ